jgi:hypothetical protein
MKFSTTKALVGLAAGTAILAGCNGSTPQLFAPSATQTSSVAFDDARLPSRPVRERSWMVPGAQQQPSLLYVSNSGTSTVTVYTYLNGSGLLLVGTLSGFSLPTGMCTDNAGNVWIPDYDTGALYEYAHGGSSPIEIIRQHSGHPYGCAVDPKTGNLAVTDQHPNGKYQSFSVVDVFPKGSKTGRPYSPANGFKEVYFDAYDNMGNLYADGTPCQSDCYYGGGPPALFELSKGGSVFTQLTLSGGTLYQPSAVNWVKPILLVGDQNFQNRGTNGAYKLFVSGSTATVVGTLQFAGTQQTYGFWRRAGRVVVPDHTGNVVRIYNLSDGTLFSKLSSEISLPFGAVVSQSAGT